MAIAVPGRRIEFLGTGGILGDIEHAAEIRDRWMPPTAAPSPITAILDLGGVQPTAGALRELILPLGQRLLGGVYGDVKIVIAAADPAVAEVIELLAREHRLPLYLASSSRPEDVAAARPLGDLTETDRQTLDVLRAVGGEATVSAMAGVIGLSATAINNRLSALDRKGYLHKRPRGRRRGDLYVDPRVSADELSVSTRDQPDVSPPRDALFSRGIMSDPYDRSRLVLDGDAAERAAEILRRRGKLQ